VNRFFYWLADQLPPWYQNTLPDELQLPEIPPAVFLRGTMLREAHLGDKMQVPCGIFRLLGLPYARRAAHAWRPRELYLMEDISLAFHLVESQRHRAIMVEPIHIDRLVETLYRYLQYIGDLQTRAKVHELVNQYLDEHSAAEVEVDPRALRRITVDHPLLERLRDLDKEARQRFPSRFDRGLAGVGLILYQQLVVSTCEWCPPLNCRTFAETGGDGIHFSLLVQDGAITENSPIVMTIPPDGGQSLIVGETLYDFLCFGAHNGFFALPIWPDATLRPYPSPASNPDEVPHSSARSDSEERERQVLAFLIAQMDLQPWTSMRKLTQLQEKYGPLLRLPPDVAS